MKCCLAVHNVIVIYGIDTILLCAVCCRVCVCCVLCLCVCVWVWVGVCVCVCVWVGGCGLVGVGMCGWVCTVCTVRMLKLLGDHSIYV